MSKTQKPSHLIEKEKLLYLEIEQLRYRLYLHDESILFEFLSIFYFAFQDAKSPFIKKRMESEKNKITKLQNKKKLLQFLETTPYAWIVFTIRNIRRTISSQFIKRQEITNELVSKNVTFVIYGSTYFTDLQSRSVQIAKKLSEKYKVIYVEGIFDEGKRSGFRIIQEDPSATVVRLTAQKSPHLDYQKPPLKELKFLKKSFHRFNVRTLKRLNVQTYIHHPFWKLFIPLKKNGYYFDHANDYAHIHNAALHIAKAQKQLIKNACVVTSPIKCPVSKQQKNIVIHNGVDWELFKDTSKTIQTCDVGLCWIKKPVMGFIGKLDERVDEILLGKLAKSFPTSSIVLVGNTDYRPVIDVAEQHPNIFPVGKQPYKKLPLFLKSFDILIVPYKSFQHNDALHPELPLYLASGKPIIATALATAAVAKGQLKQKQYIYLPTSHIGWMDAVSEALKEKKRSRKKYLRIAHAKKLKWAIPKLLY